MKNYKDGLLGLSVGEAFGVQYDGEDFNYNINDLTLIGYNAYDVDKGNYSDDTCMCLAVMASFIEKREFDYNNIADKFCDWINNNEYASSDSLFDISKTVRFALMDYWEHKDYTVSGKLEESKMDASCLSRVLPVAEYALTKGIPEKELYLIVKNIVSITHNNEIAFLGAFILTKYLIYILDGNDSKKALASLKRYKYDKFFSEETIDKYNRILKNNIKDLKLKDINNNSNVVSVIESVLWIITNTDSYKDAVVSASVIGNANGVRSSITGLIAGILYGKKNIPKTWLEMLKRKDYLEKIQRRYNTVLK